MHKIYKITNILNGNIYIGYTSLEIDKRFKLHKKSKAKNMPIVNAIKKYGEENFKIELIEEHETKHEAVKREIDIIAELSPQYNVHVGGTGGPRFGDQNGMFGKKHSKEWRENKSIDMTGSNNHMYGKKHSEESIHKMRQSRLGKEPWNKGKKGVYSRNTLSKMSKPKTEEHKNKLRKKYIVNGELIANAKEFCLHNNYNYIMFTQSAKHNKPYKNLVITVAA